MDKSLARRVLLFFTAFISTADPESVYPRIWLAVQATLHLQTGNVPASVAEILLLLIIANDFEKPPVTASEIEDVDANEALVTEEALTAKDAVPNRDPVIPPETFKDPVILLLSRDTNPFLVTNSFILAVF